jgi:hypothetical protein
MQHSDRRLEMTLLPPNNSLQLTRLACEKGYVPCPPGCAIMDGALPEPPGS